MGAPATENDPCKGLGSTLTMHLLVLGSQIQIKNNVRDDELT